MRINHDNNRNVLINIKRIYKNYNLLKSFAKSSTRISIPNDSYWRYILHNSSPSLSDICKHLIYTDFFYVYKSEDYYIKYAIFPNKRHIKECQIYNSIIRKESNRIKDADYDRLFNDYDANKLFYNINVFKKYFEEFYDYYSKPENLVEILDKVSLFKWLETYIKL